MMRIFSLIVLCFVCLLYSCTFEKKQDMSVEILEKYTKQTYYLVSQVDSLRKYNNKWVAPRTIDPSGKIKMVHSSDWTSGFFAGELWYTYKLTKDKYFLAKAIEYTKLLEQEQFNNQDHDIGFRIFCSYGNGFKITKDSIYRDIVLQAAQTLYSRYNEKTGCIKSWDKKQWQFPVIIDNLMNLELLFWASKESGDTIYQHVALNHASNTMKNHYREDFSSYHVVDYDTLSGKVLSQGTHQGLSNSSSWARGQAWGLYGYTMIYRESGKKEFLLQAEEIAKFIINHSRLPDDLIPYWDFDDPEIPNAPRDASAAAIVASALYELSTYTEFGEKYVQFADRILETLSSDSYFADYKTNGGFLLKHSTGNKPKNSEVDVPIIYADYYFIEAIARRQYLKEKDPH